MTEIAGGSAASVQGPGNTAPPDQWSSIAAEREGDAESAGLPSSAPVSGRRLTALEAVSAGLMLLAALLQVIWIAAGRIDTPLTVRIFAFPQMDADYGGTILAMIVFSVLILGRHRRFGLRVTAVLGSSLVLSDFQDFRPSQIVGRTAPHPVFLFVVSLAIAGLAGLCAFAAVAAEWRAQPRVPAGRPSARRVRLLCLGAALALLVSGVGNSVLPWRLTSFAFGPIGGGHTTCCTLSQRTGPEQVSLFCALALMLGIVLLATLESSRMRSAAWLVAVTVVAVPVWLQYAADAVWPGQSAFGWDNMGLLRDGGVRVTLQPGYWLDIACRLIVLAVAVVRLRSHEGRTSDPYSEQR